MDLTWGRPRRGSTAGRERFRNIFAAADVCRSALAFPDCPQDSAPRSFACIVPRGAFSIKQIVPAHAKTKA